MSEKCAKCGITSLEDSSLSFYRFPSFNTADPETFFRLLVWAEFCYPHKKIDVVFLQRLCMNGKTLCSKHFEHTSYTNVSRTKFSKYSVPIGTESIVRRLTRRFSRFSQVLTNCEPASSKVVLEQENIHNQEFLLSPAETKVCRICLATGVKMYHMKEHSLHRMYESLTGTAIESSNELPKVFCWECSARLKSAQRFKIKATSTYNHLVTMSTRGIHLTVQTIVNNDLRHNLKSSLTKKYFNDHYDLTIHYDDNRSEHIKQENEMELEIFDDECKDNKKVFRVELANENKTDKNIGENIDFCRNDNSTKSESDTDDNRDPLFDDDDSKSDGIDDIKEETLKVEKVPNLVPKQGESLADLKRRTQMKTANIKRKLTLVEAQTDEKKRIVKLVERKPDVAKKKDNEMKMSNDLNIKINTNRSGNLSTLRRKAALSALRRKIDLSSIKKHADVNTLQNNIDLHKDVDLNTIQKDKDVKVAPRNNNIKTIKDNANKIKRYSDLKKLKKKMDLRKVKIKLVKKKRIIKKKGKRKYISSKISTNDYIEPDDPLHEYTVTYLNYEDQLADLNRRAGSPTYQNAKWKCTVCYNVFRVQVPLENHLLRHSEDLGKFECAMCLYRFRTLPKLREHIRSRHTELFTCKKCNYSTTYRARARAHVSNHSGKSYRCPHCDEEFKYRSTYFSHVRIKHPAKYVCEICGHTFLSEKGVFLHKKKSHPNLDVVKVNLNGPFCQDCVVKFADQDAYDRHLLLSSVHSEERKFSSIRNDPVYLSKSGPLEISSWLSVFDNPKSVKNRKSSGDERNSGLPCEVCEETIIGIGNYSRHIKSEHPDHVQTRFRAQPHMCEVCGKIVSSSLALHKLSHSQEKQQCPYCQKSYAFHSNLKRHIIVEHKGLRYPCEICGKELTSAKGRREHITHVHHGQPRPKRVRVRMPSAD